MGARATRTRRAGVVNAMTIDVEDYFQVSAFDRVVPRAAWEKMSSRVEGNTMRLLRLLDEHGVRATFFVLGWVAERYPALVRAIAEGGHELASHGHGHRLVYEQSPPAFRLDLQRAKRAIEDAAGVTVTGYRAPSFSITARSLWALDILIEEGYRYDASIFPIRHDRYGIPGSPRHAYTIARPAGSLVEAPASTVRVGGMTLPVAGGGYLRLLPYGWTRWGIRRLNGRERQPAIVYLHPWEVDPEQPRLPAGRVTTFRHSHNLDRVEGRLRRLVREFRFAPLGEVLASQPAEAAEPVLQPMAEAG
jgi:polysaccharide deacetylase family protein (PEP-CTERM system associated)